MAFPAEFSYANENDFIQRFLIPLLTRLGFLVPVNYHGQREYGKDLVFAEVDRFSNVLYHGLQAKYEASIGQAATQSLIDDCMQAFAVPFDHPTIAGKHRIASFTLVNGGSFGPNVREWFQAGVGQFAGCTRVFDGQALLALDRMATANRAESIRERLTALRREIDFNLKLISDVQTTLEAVIAGQPVVISIVPLRTIALADYLSVPFLGDFIDYSHCERYWCIVNVAEHVKHTLTTLGLANEKKLALCKELLPELGIARMLGEQISIGAELALLKLGPLATV